MAAITTTAISQLEHLVNHGRYLEACADAAELLKGESSVRVSQLYALALSKSGSPEAARDYLEPMQLAAPDDAETAGILGSIYKELFRKNQQSSFAQRSRDTYLRNFEITRSYYTGINAASMSAMVMQSSRSKVLAREVTELIAPSTNDFWEVATLAEAALLLKDKERASDLYVRARKLAGTDWGRVISVHNQLWLLNHYVPVASEIMRVFSPPRVAAFIGHMIDHPRRPTPRFPASIEANVKESIKANIRRLQAQIGYCSLACGSDILFAEAMAEEGGEVTVILPFDVGDFIETSVRFAGEHWVERFQELAKKFHVNFITTEPYAGHDDLFSFQGRVICGTAVLRSALYHAEPALLTVASETDLKRKEGGTRDTIAHWPYPSQHVNVNPEMFTSAPQKAPTAPGPEEKKQVSGNRPVQFMIHVATPGLNVLDSEKIQKAIDRRASEEASPFIVMKDADGSLILSFDFETAAIEMVRSLLETIRAFRNDPDIRMTLHAGPAFKSPTAIKGNAVDILKRLGVFSLPRAISASSAFAALLALLPRLFSIEYAGTVAGVESSADQMIYRVNLIK